jgi:hypothetical protein
MIALGILKLFALTRGSVIDHFDGGQYLAGETDHLSCRVSQGMG